MKNRLTIASAAFPQIQPFVGSVSPAASLQPLRMVLYSPHQLHLSALRSLFDQSTRYVVTAESLSFDASLDRAVSEHADIVVIDFELDGRNSAGMLSFETFLRKATNVPSVILTSALDPDMCQRTLRAGVTGIVAKNISGEALMEVVDQISKGRMWLERSLMTAMFADSSHNVRAKCADSRKIAELTPRELEIVATASTGATNRHIGERLFISSSTVRHHLSSIFAKLGVASRGELMVYAYRHNLAGPSARSNEG